jgi:hypothetical protein
MGFPIPEDGNKTRLEVAPNSTHIQGRPCTNPTGMSWRSEMVLSGTYYQLLSLHLSQAVA